MSVSQSWYIDWVVILRPTQHKIGHFGDVPQANLLAWYGKTKPNTTKAHIHQSKKCTRTQNKHKKLNPGLVASHDIIWPGNGEGLFWFWRFINLSLTSLIRHLPTYSQPQDPHGARSDTKRAIPLSQESAVEASDFPGFRPVLGVSYSALTLIFW